MTASPSNELEFRKWKILIELKHLPKVIGDGIYCLPSSQSLFEWHGTLFLRQGLYRGGIFKFKFELPPNYPTVGPTKITFNQSAIPFHPQIKQDTGDLLLARSELANWNGEIHGVAHVLKYVKQIFYQIEASGFQNMNAAELYLNNRKEFEKQVALSVAKSNADDNLYQNSPNSLVSFQPYQKEHEYVRVASLARPMPEEEPETKGAGVLSFVSTLSKLLA